MHQREFGHPPRPAQFLDFVFASTLIAQARPLGPFLFVRSSVGRIASSSGSLAGTTLRLPAITTLGFDPLVSDDSFGTLPGARAQMPTSASSSLAAETHGSEQPRSDYRKGRCRADTTVTLQPVISGPIHGLTQGH